MQQQQQQQTRSSKTNKMRGTSLCGSLQPSALTAVHPWTPYVQQQHARAAGISRQMTHCY
jgi:hypothetical protein